MYMISSENSISYYICKMTLLYLPLFLSIFSFYFYYFSPSLAPSFFLYPTTSLSLFLSHVLSYPSPVSEQINSNLIQTLSNTISSYLMQSNPIQSNPIQQTIYKLESISNQCQYQCHIHSPAMTTSNLASLSTPTILFTSFSNPALVAAEHMPT